MHKKIIRQGLPWWHSGLRIHLPRRGTWVQSLVQEDPTCLGATKPMEQRLSLPTATLKACAPQEENQR